MKKRSKILIICLGVFVLTTVVPGIIMMSSMNNLGKAANATKKLADNLYYIEISGDDGVKGFLENGGATCPQDIASYIEPFLSRGPFKKTVSIEPKPVGCSAFIAQNPEGGYVVGRNFDWQKCVTIILKDTPDQGYASISTVNIDFLKFGEGFVPEGIVNKIKALAGIYVPLDGINEMGLVVADLMAGDKDVTDQQTEKPDLTTTSSIRMLLNCAKDVDEAVELLGRYDMHSDIGSAHHLFIADKNGKSVVVEWVDNVMNVKETPVLTNHYMTGEKAGTGNDNSKQRFDLLSQTLSNAGNTLSPEQARDALNSVKASNYSKDEMTQWSIVYNLSNMSENFYFRSDYSKSYDYSVLKGKSKNR